MSRVIEVTVPSDRTDQLLAELQSRGEAMGLRVQRGSSIEPPGDVVTITTTNRSMPKLVRILDEYGVGTDSGTSLTSTEPVSLVVPSGTDRLSGDSSEGTWEEIESIIVKESNTTGNTLLVMAISGALAAVGLATNALHLVIAAMLIAPGFEPIIRITMGIVGRSGAWRHGIAQTMKGYAALLVGAAATAAVLDLSGTSPIGEDSSYLPPSVLVSYWTTFSVSAVIASATAGVAGAILVAANRSVLTGGVMIALALVPSATLVGAAFVDGDLALAGEGALRWALDVVLVLAGSLLVFAWKRVRTYKRDSVL